MPHHNDRNSSRSHNHGLQSVCPLHRTLEVLWLKMEVQRSVSRRLGGKEYVKHQIVIPNNVIEQLGWSQGDHLETRISSKGLLIYRIQAPHRIREPQYEDFKEAVIEVLSALPNGCAWSELKQKAKLPQLTPSPMWVKKLEDDACLKRIRDPATSQIIWRLEERAFGVVDYKTLNGWMPKR
jgi:antitoxin component of MazEF toxin-antitoxin module